MVRTWEELEKLQPIVLKMLKNSLLKNRVAHAYLFEGIRGTGKKEISLLLAKSVFCLNKQEYKPCGECINCRRIDSGNHPDLHLVEPDGLSIKKTQIQELREEFTKTGVESNKKMYIIQHADRMTANAANSLLKFLEEPNSDTIAILLTENLQKMLNTIISRCQVLSFTPLSPEVITEGLLQEGVPAKMAMLVSRVTNNLDEAIQLSHDDWFAQARDIVIKLYEMLCSNPKQALFFLQEQWVPHFSEKDMINQGLDLLLLMYKDVLSIQLGEEQKVIYQDLVPLLKERALKTTQTRVTEQMLTILESKRRLYTNVNPLLLMEQMVLKL